MPIDVTLRALDGLIRAGKVRYSGTSTYSAWQLMESLWVAKELGLNRFVCEQPPCNLLDRRIERELVPMAQTYGLALAWCLRQPGITSPIVGPRSVEQLDDNLGALDVEIAEEDLAALNKASAPGTHVSPFYGADFGASQYRW